MAKRFTDTDKWKKPFIKSLPAEYKLFWLFLLDECDHSGIWHIEMEIAEMRLGIKLSTERIRGLFKERVVEFDNGTKAFVPDFIEFQYGSLNPDNKAHKSVIDKLSRYNLMGHVSPLQGAMDKDKDKELDKVRGGPGEILFPIEQCLTISLADTRFSKANKTNQEELEKFNEYLEKQGIYDINPLDYKRYFAKLKGKYPDVVKTKLSAEDFRRLIEEKEKRDNHDRT